MKKKIFFQLFFLLLISLLSIFFFKKYFLSVKVSDITKKEEKINTNLINDIKYQASDKDGNSYIITAKSGTAIPDEVNKIKLKDVKAKLIFDNQKEIVVNSKFAIYDQDIYDTEFIDNVKINYELQNVTCNNLIVRFSENIAILKNNLIFKNSNTKMFADQMNINLLTRTSKIFMLNDKDKIKVIYITENGTN